MTTPIHPTGIGSNAPDGPPAPPLLDPAGAHCILGGSDPFVGPLAPTRHNLFGPRGAYLFSPDGPLWVADTGHHRLLGWKQCPTEDGQPADWVLGQPDFETEGRNAGGDTSAYTLNVPVGIHPWKEDGMIVADSWNHRVLVWFKRPQSSNVPADLILGQMDETGDLPNHGQPDATASSMHWPSQVKIIGERLFVADTGNRRVLVWEQLPTQTGQPADYVLGQKTLDARSDNGGEEATAGSLRWPHDLAFCRDTFMVADAGNNRVLIWDTLPTTSNPPADRVLGQKDFTQLNHNQGQYWPTAASMNMPYAMDACEHTVIVADTANSRLLGWSWPLTSSAEAQTLTGQPHFLTKGDNRWQSPERDSLCWPYGLQISGDTIVISDSGNHRILFWRFAQGTS
ncbi:MAG: hypothetical protein CL920_04900 [Deltaproteobacteria bacterium]|nr:hypothetical protein [Deltaproteobacteria bacterium]